MFRKLSIATVIAVYFLILVGGIVRSTGSGMGCPDWPKCFGNWVPPTSAEQLPTNYQDVYAGKRLKKNERLAGYLNAFGLNKLALKIQNDPSIAEEAEFNAVKTWIEYINRLIGVVIGLLIVATLIASVKFIRTQSVVFWGALASFILVVFQGWVGSVVVSTNLLPGLVTFHMLLALLIVGILLYIAYKTSAGLEAPPQVERKKLLNALLTVCILTFVVQITLGTQVREAVDVAAAQLGQQARGTWVEHLGVSFLVHRSYSWLVLILNLFLVYMLRRYTKSSLGLQRWTYVLIGCIVIEIATGAAMATFGIPPYLQPVHLLLASVIIGVQFMIMLMLNTRPQAQTQPKLTYAAT